MNIKEIKKLSKELNVNVDTLIALSKANDPFYIQKNSREKAEWFKEVWEKEGWRKKYERWVRLGKPQDEESKQKYLTHPRGLHYRILDKEYQIKFGNKSISYKNTEQCWNYLEKGAKYARLLDLVPYDGISDMQNPDPTNVPTFYGHDEFEIKDVYLIDDIVELKLPRLRFDNTAEFIEDKIEEIMNDLFENVHYYPNSDQPNYLEIWAEKKGVIPIDVAKEFNMTIRPAGGGEFSLDMCHFAVKKAKESKKKLHIFILSDFDPKGKDMPKSVARKVEFIAKKLDVIAFVHHVALTKEQCIEHTLPSVPAKIPKNIDKGGKGYLTHTELFRKFAGRDVTELNSFLERKSEAYRETIRNAIRPYYDKELAEKFKDELNRLREGVRKKLEIEFDKRKEDLNDIRGRVKDVLEDLSSALEPIIIIKKKELNLDALTKEYSEKLNLNIKEFIKDEKFEIPEARVEIPKDALLDTRRSYSDQIKKYKEFDIRENNLDT